MTEFVVTAVLGVIVSVLGIINMTGNISSLHWYHRQRVTEENRKPFGRLVGIGTLIIGISLIAWGILYYISELFGLEVITFVAIPILVVGVIAGLVLSFYAMIKYNGGIF